MEKELVKTEKEEKQENRKPVPKGTMISYLRKNKGGLYSKKGPKKTTFRKPERLKKGLMVAIPVDEEEVKLGWSLCAFTKGDGFNNERAFEIAVSRALGDSRAPVPDSMQKKFIRFAERARKYYQTQVVTMAGMPVDDLIKRKDDVLFHNRRWIKKQR